MTDCTAVCSPTACLDFKDFPLGRRRLPSEWPPGFDVSKGRVQKQRQLHAKNTAKSSSCGTSSLDHTPRLAELLSPHL